MRTAILPFAALVLAACPDDPQPGTNPPRLWLWTPVVETQVVLSPEEPPREF